MLYVYLDIHIRHITTCVLSAEREPVRRNPTPAGPPGREVFSRRMDLLKTN